jgi:hypothetical protein
VYSITVENHRKRLVVDIQYRQDLAVDAFPVSPSLFFF